MTQRISDSFSQERDQIHAYFVDIFLSSLLYVYALFILLVYIFGSDVLNSIFRKLLVLILFSIYLRGKSRVCLGHPPVCICITHRL